MHCSLNKTYNRKMYTLACFLALLTIGIAQRPQPCKSPSAWNGKLLKFKEGGSAQVLGAIQYDELNQRVRLTEEVTNLWPSSKKDLGANPVCEYIILYGERTVYNIQKINGTSKCTKHEYNEKFTPNAVPATGKYIAQYMMGANIDGARLLVNSFAGEHVYEGEDVYYSILVTNNGCVPVHYDSKGPKSGIVHGSYYDISPGVDPGSFVPPADCTGGRMLTKLRDFPDCAAF